MVAPNSVRGLLNAECSPTRASQLRRFHGVCNFRQFVRDSIVECGQRFEARDLSARFAAQDRTTLMNAIAAALSIYAAAAVVILVVTLIAVG